MSDRSIAAEKAWETRRQKKKKWSEAGKKAYETRMNKYKDLRQSIRLIECLPEEEYNFSEVKMLRQQFRIINNQMRELNKEEVKFPRSIVSTPRDLLKVLDNTKQSCIHISCHGKHYKNYRKTALQLPNKNLYSDQIHSPKSNNVKLWQDRLDNDKATPLLIFLSACETAYAQDLAERFMQAGVRFIIAPKEETFFHDSALFASAFYTLFFVERNDPDIAFKKVKSAFRMSGKWKFYDAYSHNFTYYDPDGNGRFNKGRCKL